MSGVGGEIFNDVLRHIIKKSLFTERQIQIILKKRDLMESEFPITRGAYYRQVGQVREKVLSFFYTAVLLRVLGVFSSDDVDVIMQLSEQVGVIWRDEMPLEKSDEVVDLVDRVMKEVFGRAYV